MSKRYGMVRTSALHGVDGVTIEIEVVISSGLPGFDIVGLADSAIRESRNRVQAAVRSSGFTFPNSRITASLAPAYLPKQGSAFDFPLALAILLASGQIRPSPDPLMAFGELTLDGQIRGVPGAISRYAALSGQNPRRLLIPRANQREVGQIAGDNVQFVSSLREAVACLNNPCRRSNRGISDPESEFSGHSDPDNLHISVESEVAAGSELEKGMSARDISSIIGQDQAVRAMEIAAAGQHNLLLLGSPGCGKTALVSTMTGILPPLTVEESLELTRLYSAAGLLNESEGLITRRPFRSPHHTITRSAMIGGGSIPKPGEASLAHRGVLFLDEMTEFDPAILDTLRQPLEEQQIRISRSLDTFVFPASFLLVGAANPCRCGNYYEEDIRCKCSPEVISSHFSRISGPLLDRIDLVVGVSRLNAKALERTVQRDGRERRTSAETAARIRIAQERQRQRCMNQGLQPELNGRLQTTLLAEHLGLPPDVLVHAASAADKMRLSVRGYQKILRIARTIADLEGEETVSRQHLGEALQYRPVLGGERA